MIGSRAKGKDRPLMGLRPVFLNPRTQVRTWGTRSELREGWKKRKVPGPSRRLSGRDDHCEADLDARGSLSLRRMYPESL